MKRLIRSWIACAAALVALAAAPALAAAAEPAWTADPDDALLLDARLGRYQVGEGVRGYATQDGSCLIFADVAATLDLAIAVDTKARTAKGWAFSERNRVEIDRGARRIRVRDRVSALGAHAIRDTPEGWCVDTASLASWLGISLTADQTNALLIVQSTDKLPVELSQERKARTASIRPAVAARDPATLPQIKLPYLDWRTPSLDAVVTVNGVRDRLSGTRAAVRYDLFASGEIARMSVDARLASDDRGVPTTLRARAYRTDPDGGLLGSLRATHVALGDVSSFASPLVGSSNAGRGAVITNRPVDRPDSFDRTSFRGELASGWDAELYRNGQLLGFARDRTDGRYEFIDVPLLYGANRFEIVLYGPQGQVRRRQESVAVGAESIPTGRTDYWAGVSQDDRDLIRIGGHPFDSGRGWRGTVGVEHGLDAKTSLSAQLHSLVLRDERLTFVEGAVRRAVGPALVEISAAYEIRGGVALRAQMLGQFGDTYVTAESVKALRGFTSDRVEAGVIGRHSVAVDHNIRLGRTILPTHLEARYVEQRSAPGTLEAAARIATSFRGFSLTAGLDWQSRLAQGRDPPPDRLTAQLIGNGRIGDVRVRGEGRYRLAGERWGFEGATVVGEWGASNRALWRAEVGYDGFSRRARAGLGYSRRFERFALGVNGEAASDGSIAAGLNFAFSVGPTPRGGMRLTSRRLGSAGSAVARVFRDLNQDGTRQNHEPFEKGVQLTAGTSLVGSLTDDRGEAIIDELAPFRTVAIGVDTTSLADPLIQPLTAAQRIVPRPGIATRIDIPLVGAGEVEGTLVRPDGAGIEGVDLELVDAGGAVRSVARTDFDGYFVFEKVAYGDYAMRIGRLSAQAAKLVEKLSAHVRVGPGKPTVAVGSVVASSSEVRTAAQ